MKKNRKTPTSIKEGDWLISAMENAGYSNVRLADEIGLGYNNLVSQWRTGACPMSDLQMLKCAKVLKTEAFSVRPGLLEYVDVLSGSALLDGLEPKAVDQVLGLIALFKANQGHPIHEGSVSLKKGGKDKLASVT